MKANLYTEVEQPIEPIDEHKLATASERPEHVNAPKQELYIVNYKALMKPTLIALVILAVWAVATWVL